MWEEHDRSGMGKYFNDCDLCCKRKKEQEDLENEGVAWLIFICVIFIFAFIFL